MEVARQVLLFIESSYDYFWLFVGHGLHVKALWPVYKIDCISRNLYLAAKTERVHAVFMRVQ